MKQRMKRPQIGLSACLQGQPVRYNGEHCRDKWLMDDLGPHVDWQPQCPEVAMGLGVPRATLRRQRTSAGAIQLLEPATGRDHTAAMTATSQTLLSQLPPLDGFIFKNRSPTCGLERVKLYDRHETPTREGRGLFAQALVDAHPHLPVTEEGRLKDAVLRDHFVTAIFAHARFRQLEPSLSALQNFHRQYKFILMAHDEKIFRQLGPLVANSQSLPCANVFATYHTLFFTALQKPARRQHQCNAILHLFGFVKKHLEAREKSEFLRLLDDYRQGELPQIAISTLLNHFRQRVQNAYLNEQLFFQPYPAALKIQYNL